MAVSMIPNTKYVTFEVLFICMHSWLTTFGGLCLNQRALRHYWRHALGASAYRPRRTRRFPPAKRLRGEQKTRNLLCPLVVRYFPEVVQIVKLYVSTPVLHHPRNKHKTLNNFPKYDLKPGFGENHPHTRRGAIQSSFCLRSPYWGTGAPQNADPNPSEFCRGLIRS